MVFVHDVECFPNFFSVVLWSIDESVKKTFYIYKDHNDIEEIIELYENPEHWFAGYNSSDYDDIIIEKLIYGQDRYKKISSDQITEELYNLSYDIVEENAKHYSKNLFKSIDLKRIGNLYKSLKLVAVNLKHQKIQDLPKPFNELVEDDEVEEILLYNDNDVSITYKLYHHLRDEIQLRQKLSKKYGQNLMNYPDSGIANRILENDYESFSGIPQPVFKRVNTKRDKVDFNDIILKKISFESNSLSDLLETIKNTKAGQGDKVEFKAMVGKTRYDILKGGIHSNMPPCIYESKDGYKIVDMDVTSYYPYAMINNNIKPAHLHKCFLPLLKGYVETRVKAKRNKDKIAADSLKIVINSIYGKMGNEYHFLYDVAAMYQVTLNCQLFLLMLIEWIEDVGIEVFYANTDGVTAYVPEDRINELKTLCNSWEEYTGFQLEFDEYKKCIIRDVNSYIWIPYEGQPKYKNVFDPLRYKDLGKAFDKPIVPIAVSDYFVKDVPVEDTITGHDDIFDFCMAQKPGEKFDIYFDYIDEGKLVTEQLQQSNRYYVCKKGGNIYKLDGSKRTSLVAGEGVALANDVEDRNPSNYPVKYRYYIQEAYKLINLFKDNQMDLFI